MRRAVYFLVLVPGLLFADDVYLKGGAVFSGRIVEQTDTMVTIDIGDGEIGVAVSRIERIEKKRSALDEFDERAAKLAPNDVDGWRNLGGWASDQGLGAQSQRAYQKVLNLSPDDAEARGALGFVQYNGQWMTLDESYRARGYVKHDGQWMTPNEAQMTQQAANANQARDDAERRANLAEADKILAESRADKAEERARDAEQRTDDFWNNQPSPYGGGYGWGVTGWPSNATVHWRNGYQPARSAPINTNPR